MNNSNNPDFNNPTTSNRSFTMLVQELTKLLQEKYPENAQTVTWWLLEHVTQKTKLELITSTEQNLTDQQADNLETIITKLVIEDYPLQYILATVSFGNLVLNITPPTLIPRPETEDFIIKLIDQLKSVQHEKLTILDLCTGSGCIALALAQALPNSIVYAIDIAQTALELAQKNAQKNNITNIIFLQSDLYSQLSQENLKFDSIISNPPYISQQEWETLEPNVKNWEDKQALVPETTKTTGATGLELLEKIISQAPNFLKTSTPLQQFKISQFILEIGHTQGATVQKLCKQAGFKTVTVVQDLYTKDRFVTCLF